MPERRFDDGYWDDPFVQPLSKDGKLLYAYLWTNKHCNQAGLYQITPSTIAFETKLAEADIPEIFGELAPKVVWYREENLVWVKNFIKRQSISSKFLVAVARCLIPINNNGAIEALLKYNRDRYGLEIPYQYPINRVSIPSTSPSTSNTLSNNKGVGRGEELSVEEKNIMKCLDQLKGWQADEDDVPWHKGLRSEFPGFTLAELKACVDYYSGRAPPKHKGVWKNRFRNWMIKNQEFERRDRGEQQPRATQERRRPITYTRGTEPVGPEDSEDLP